MTEFETLYRSYAPALHRYALYLCGDPTEAEDLTSEAFVRAWNSSEPIRTGSAKAYLFTIVRNCFLNQQLRKKKQVPLEEGMVDPGANPFRVAARNDDLKRVLGALQQLAEVDRSIILLRVQEDLSYQEIADVLAISLAAVKVRIHRARLRLTELLNAKQNYEYHQKCN